MGSKPQVNPYAGAKLHELLESLFCDVRSARTKLAEQYATFFIISPADFHAKNHQDAWEQIQRKLTGKLVNFGSKRIPDERLTIRNSSIETILRNLWSLYFDLR